MKVLEKLSTALKETTFKSFQDFKCEIHSCEATDSKEDQLQNKASNYSHTLLRGIGQVFEAAAGVDSTVSTGLVLNSIEDAQLLGKQLFKQLRKGNNEFVYSSDFLRFFNSNEAAEDAFLLFDKDDNGDASKMDMVNGVVDIFIERNDLETSLKQSGQAIEKLDLILRVPCVALILFCSIGIWGVDASKFLTAAVSVWAGLLFAGGSIYLYIDEMYSIFFKLVERLKEWLNP